MQQTGNYSSANKKKIVILVSGYGTNLQTLIKTFQINKLGKIELVISDNPQSYALTRASKHGINSKVIQPKKNWNSELLTTLLSIKPDLILLAGFMQKIPNAVIKQFANTIINIHPSLLPKYKGLNTHERVLQGKEKVHGISIHFVDKEIDEGPCIAQSSLTIKAIDTVESLKDKIHQLEWQLYPKIVILFLQNRLTLKSNKIHLDGVIINQPLKFKLQNQQ